MTASEKLSFCPSRDSDRHVALVEFLREPEEVVRVRVTPHGRVIAERERWRVKIQQDDPVRAGADRI
jgi:hypothetical protein